MRSPGTATTRFTSRIPSAGDGNTMMSPRCGSAHLAICQVVNGTLRSYASLLIKIRSPTKMVGIIEPLGTSFQSATADRNGARIATATKAGKIHSRQKARSCCFMGDWTRRTGGLFNEPKLHDGRAGFALACGDTVIVISSRHETGRAGSSADWDCASFRTSTH